MNRYLILGGYLSLVAAILHIGIIIGGADWYRFFGAGEALAMLAEQGSLLPGFVTAGIAFVLSIWSIYAFSGAGWVRPLPWLKWSLIIISVIYLCRGLTVIPIVFFTEQRVDAFLIWSSIISTIFGISYAFGTRQMIWENS